MSQNLGPVPGFLQDSELKSTGLLGMQNKLWKDLTNRLAQEPFERIYWGWGPQWVSFIKIDSPITVDKPLWAHEETNLDNIRLFDLTPDQLQREIIRYWQQPFWKRWFLSLLTSINRKIKLWSYYHRCLAVRTACIENIYRIDKLTDSLFEQYLGEEVVERLYRTTLKLTKYLEKHAGDFKFEENGVDFYLRGNRRFFKKLMNKKLASLDIENKANLQKRLEKEFDRHKMMLFSYLADWEKKIFDEPIYFDKPIPFDTCIDPRTGKKMTYSTQSIEEWVKLKRQIFGSMLQEEAPEEFLNIKAFLESTLSTIKQLFNQQLERYEKLIFKVRCDRLAAEKAIQQANILQKYFIIFKKIVFLFHPDKSFGNENLRAIQTELFKEYSCLAKDSIEKIQQGLQTLEECLITQKNKLAFQEMKNGFNSRIVELKKIIHDLNDRIEVVRYKIRTNYKETELEVDEEIEQIEIEIEEMRYNYSEFLKPRSPLKLTFKPSMNYLEQDEPKEEVYETYEAKSDYLNKKTYARYTPVF